MDIRNATIWISNSTGRLPSRSIGPVTKFVTRLVTFQKGESLLRSPAGATCKPPRLASSFTVDPSGRPSHAEPSQESCFFSFLRRAVAIGARSRRGQHSAMTTSIHSRYGGAAPAPASGQGISPLWRRVMPPHGSPRWRRRPLETRSARAPRRPVVDPLRGLVAGAGAAVVLVRSCSTHVLQQNLRLCTVFFSFETLGTSKDVTHTCTHSHL
jgi:hypothetical protein